MSFQATDARPELASLEAGGADAEEEDAAEPSEGVEAISKLDPVGLGGAAVFLRT